MAPAGPPSPGLALAELIASEEELLGRSRIQTGSPGALSMPSARLIKAVTAGSPTWLWEKKGTQVRAAVSQQGHAPNKLGLNCPGSGLVVSGQQPIESPATGELQSPQLGHGQL